MGTDQVSYSIEVQCAGGGMGECGGYMLYMWSQGTSIKMFSLSYINLMMSQEFGLVFLYIEKGSGVSHTLWRYDMCSPGGREMNYNKWLH